jgi:hypothetical protein
MYLFAARTTSLPEARPLTPINASLLSEASGAVPSTSEGSSGPAVAPSVNVPCDGAPPAHDVSDKTNSEIQETRPAAIRTVERTNIRRRISPPPGNASRVWRHSNRISTRKQLFFEEFFKFFAERFRLDNFCPPKWAGKSGDAPCGERPRDTEAAVASRLLSPMGAARPLPFPPRRASG